MTSIDCSLLIHLVILLFPFEIGWSHFNISDRAAHQIQWRPVSNPHTTYQERCTLGHSRHSQCCVLDTYTHHYKLLILSKINTHLQSLSCVTGSDPLTCCDFLARWYGTHTCHQSWSRASSAYIDWSQGFSEYHQSGDSIILCTKRQ